MYNIHLFEQCFFRRAFHNTFAFPLWTFSAQSFEFELQSRYIVTSSAIFFISAQTLITKINVKLTEKIVFNVRSLEQNEKGIDMQIVLGRSLQLQL